MTTPSPGARNNKRTFGIIALVSVAMFGFGYLLVPLYNAFCEITGLNGKTGQVSTAQAELLKPQLDRTVTVQFLANNNASMPWTFRPTVASMEVHPGKVYAATYVAKNTTPARMTGQAVPSVAPGLASRYFSKTECFCFDKQELAAGETKEMPLKFIVDPRLPKRINTITLAYTFFDVTAKSAAK